LFEDCVEDAWCIYLLLQQITGCKNVYQIEEYYEVPKEKTKMECGMWRIYMLYDRRQKIL
jgi:hypothetical protein